MWLELQSTGNPLAIHYQFIVIPPLTIPPPSAAMLTVHFRPLQNSAPVRQFLPLFLPVTLIWRFKVSLKHCQEGVRKASNSVSSRRTQTINTNVRNDR